MKLLQRFVHAAMPSTRPVRKPSSKPITDRITNALPCPFSTLKGKSYYLAASKVNRRLVLCRKQNSILTFQATFGIQDEEDVKSNKKPKDKNGQGDNRTPYGIFLISQIMAVSHEMFGGYWIRIDTTSRAVALYRKQYPKTLRKWEQQNGEIESDAEIIEFNRWAKRHNKKLIFRGIGIHGGNWEGTWGCICLDDGDIKSLYEKLIKFPNRALGIPILIR